MGFCLVAAVALMSSCNKQGWDPNVPQPVENAFEGAVPTGYYSYAEISVPAGTETVFIEYTDKDGNTRTITQAVTPIVAEAKDGKDVEPFGTVKLLFEADKSSKVSVYYNITEATKADGDDSVYTLSDFPVDQITSGKFGETRYVQMPWNFAWYNSEETGWQNTKTYPKDVVFYDASHNHTLRYTFVYGGDNAVAAEGYVLTDAYVVEDHVAIATKYNYCDGCGNCPRCMPWGCDCGCGGWVGDVPVFKANTAFEPSGDTTKSAGDDATVVDTTTPGTIPTVDGTGEVTVDGNGTIYVDYAPTDLTTVQLPEPASYTTSDLYYTSYHSSGVVMFDDRWPTLPDLGYRYDYNDVVIDYDIEARTVADAYLESDGWRELVKVTLHVRALGADEAIGAGVVLESFNTDYVDYVEEYKTLDSWQNPHGELPVWTKTTLQENSCRYDNLPGAYRNSGRNSRPTIEIGRLQALNSVDGKSTGGLNSGNEVYQYVDKEGQKHDHVFNPARKLYSAWGGAHVDQYEDGLDALYQTSVSHRTLANVQGFKLYNTVPGYVNQNGGLYTYTVIYYMKPRIDMSPEQSAACKANMMETVVNTTQQNFYIVKTKFGAVGLKGYAPLDGYVKDTEFKNGYRAQYDAMVAKPEYAPNMDPSTFYLASNGMVWGFKCPTLTRHAWELMPFCEAYPHYEEWVKSNGATHADWYKEGNYNTTAVVCEW